MAVTGIFFNGHWLDELAPIQKPEHDVLYGETRNKAIWRSAEEAFDTALDFINANLEPNDTRYFTWVGNGFPERSEAFYVFVEDSKSETGCKYTKVCIPEVRVTQYEGRVFSYRDVSYFDDAYRSYSVLVWNPETQKMEHTSTTNSVKPDCKPEYIRQHLMQQYEKAAIKNYIDARLRYRKPAPERNTRIVLRKDYKPRKGAYAGTTLPAGTEGVIFWYGPSRYSNGTTFGIKPIINGEQQEEPIWRHSYDFDTLPNAEHEWKALDEFTAAHEAAWSEHGCKIAEIDIRIERHYNFASSSYRLNQSILHDAAMKKRAEERKAIADKVNGSVS